MPDLPHKTVPMLVWADVDIGIADTVRRLNEILGVRTHSSCQGDDNEAGKVKPYVMVSWAWDDVLKSLLREFDVTLAGNYWGYVHPRSL